VATVYKIHPAIGIARVGNSPDEFFVGSERLGRPPTPQGGFKDAQCRVKRQAARFRIFAHHDDGTATEITDVEADIHWTVELANTKAAHPDRHNTEPRAQLEIKPGPRTLSGPNRAEKFDTGTIAFDNAPVTTVPLGEIRSDPQNHLLVMGGAGTSASPAGTALDGYFWASDDWYDDVADGPVTATITLRADGSTPTVSGAWVLVAPPKFAPDQDSVITLYDRVRQAMVEGGLLPQPTTTSYTTDIYPILQRARDTRGVEQTGGVHTWPDPVTNPGLRAAIFAKLKNPVSGGGNMPPLNDSSTNDDTLTRQQYDHMQRWSAGTFAADWVGVPSPQADLTPDGLDRAALEACVGGAFYPGIEAGGLPGPANRPIVDPTKYAEPFRLDHAVLKPGDLTYVMALPWQNDFYQCGDNWWPVPRPNYVNRGGVANQVFIGGVVVGGQGMVDNWHKLGFVVRQAAGLVEVDRCDAPSVNLLTTVLNFQHVPQGPMGMVRETALAITFEVSAPSGPVTLQYAPGGAPNHPQLVAYNTAVTVGPTTPTAVATARLWVVYRTSTPGDVLPPQTLVVGDGSSTWTVTVTGDTVGRRSVATALVLDRSASMAEDAGGGTTKHTLLQQAASIFVDTLLEGDGVAVVRFNEDAEVLEGVVELGPGGLSDVSRSHTKDVINGPDLDPDGSTSIGDGIFEARGALAAATSPSDGGKALVVLTDGVENQPRWIADVANDITEFTYAVGLGQPQNISVSALQKVSGNNGGYLLVTGPVGTDNRFLLQKYFLQILAGISNAEIALDPDGLLLPERIERVPFQLISGDAGVDVVLLTPDPQVVDFRVETPSGQVIEPWRAQSEPGMRFVTSDGVAYYRIALPFEFLRDRFDVGGTWNAVLTLGRPRLERSDSRDGTDPSIRYAATAAPRSAQAANTSAGRLRAARDAILAAERGAEAPRAADTSDGVPYSIVVHTYSNLTLDAHAEQSGFEPGAEVRLSAALAVSGIPFDGSATVWAEVTLPFGQTFTVGMDEGNQGGYTGSFATEAVGVYRIRVRANGTTTRGEPFAREKTLSAAVWRGGDQGPDPQSDRQGVAARTGTP
jgi:L-Lysine epsilon oxidase N-terminal/L-lysine epsilon oxidase C-terminal domain/von Willebrand factor type A domain